MLAQPFVTVLAAPPHMRGPMLPILPDYCFPGYRTGASGAPEYSSEHYVMPVVITVVCCLTYKNISEKRILALLLHNLLPVYRTLAKGKDRRNYHVAHYLRYVACYMQSRHMSLKKCECTRWIN